MATIKQLSLVNGKPVQVVYHDNNYYVPIKPICEILGVNYTSQAKKIKDHPAFSPSVIHIKGITATDGKQYSMSVIPLELFGGWVFSIHPNNVSEEIREHLIDYQKACNRVLYETFFIRPQKINEKLEEKNQLLSIRMAQLDELKEVKSKISETDKKIKKLDHDISSNVFQLELDFSNPDQVGMLDPLINPEDPE